LKTYLKIILSINLFIFSCCSSALKLEGHVFVGQQIINDLESDGMLSFTLGNRVIKIPVKTNIKDAILNNKAEFLLGNIGPDVFPDVVVGQTTAHPGVEGGWKTNDWLQYLLEQVEYGEKPTAFAYGYLGHASTDVFAHTYVNQYAGDVFEIFDEILVEKRHIMLEGFIDKHLPPLKNHQGQLLPKAHQLLTIDDNFAEFLRDTLIYSDDVHQQYLKTETAIHLATITSFRNTLDDIANSELWLQLDTQIAKYIALYFFDTELSESESAILVTAANVVIDNVHSAEDDVQEALNVIYDAAEKFEASGFEDVIEATNHLEASARDLLNSKHELENKVQSLDSKLRDNVCQLIGNSITDPLSVLDPLGIADPLNITGTILDSLPGLRDLLDPFGIFGSSDPVEPEIIATYTGNKAHFLALDNAVIAPLREACNSSGSESACSVYYAVSSSPTRQFKVIADSMSDTEVITYNKWNYSLASVSESNGNGVFCDSINGAADNLQRGLLRSIQSLEHDILDQHSRLKDDVANLHAEMNKIRGHLWAMDNILFDFAQSTSQDLNPIQSYLKHWVADIDLATVEYIKATGKTMINTIDPSIHNDPDSSVFDPLQDWVSCYGLSVYGLGGLTCDALTEMKEIRDSIDFILALSVEAPLPPAIREKVEELNQSIIAERDRVEQRVQDDAFEELLEYIPEELIELIAINDFSDTQLNAFYTLPETSSIRKNLILIPDMSERIKAEMHLNNGLLDPDKYPVIRNSIVLAKLALLDYDGLRTLELDAGVPYGTLSQQTSNVVASAFTNLDGNHQWMAQSPPLPNAIGIPYRNANAQYGTHINNNGVITNGFLLWGETVRDKLFNSLFIGPLSPGIDFPNSVNKSKIVPDSYPYKPCNANPFPDGINDQSCNISWLIPIIAMMLN